MSLLTMIDRYINRISRRTYHRDEENEHTPILIRRLRSTTDSCRTLEISCQQIKIKQEEVMPEENRNRTDIVHKQ
jgi:hypothetical protein